MRGLAQPPDPILTTAQSRWARVCSWTGVSKSAKRIMSTRQRRRRGTVGRLKTKNHANWSSFVIFDNSWRWHLFSASCHSGPHTDGRSDVGGIPARIFEKASRHSIAEEVETTITFSFRKWSPGLDSGHSSHSLAPSTPRDLSRMPCQSMLVSGDHLECLSDSLVDNQKARRFSGSYKQSQDRSGHT